MFLLLESYAYSSKFFHHISTVSKQGSHEGSTSATGRTLYHFLGNFYAIDHSLKVTEILRLSFQYFTPRFSSLKTGGPKGISLLRRGKSGWLLTLLTVFSAKLVTKALDRALYTLNPLQSNVRWFERDFVINLHHQFSSTRNLFRLLQASLNVLAFAHTGRMLLKSHINQSTIFFFAEWRIFTLQKYNARKAHWQK